VILWGQKVGIYDVPIKLQCRNAENAAMDIYIIYVSLVGGLEHEFYFP